MNGRGPVVPVLPTAEEDCQTVMASLDWAREMVRKVIRYSHDAYSKSNLKSIANAMDPELNPRIGPVYQRRRVHG
jgi:hypothetical protein